MKNCTVCKVSKEHSEFNFDARLKSGLRSACKKCEMARAVKWQHKNPERKKEICDQWHRDNPHHHLFKTYGVTPAEYELKFIEQKGLCSICKTPHRKLGVDHDHQTGEIRALLCRKCNTGIGMFGDSFQMLLRAASYLRKYLTKPEIMIP